MKALIYGAGGQDGRLLSEMLQSDDISVGCVIRNTSHCVDEIDHSDYHEAYYLTGPNPGCSLSESVEYLNHLQKFLVNSRTCGRRLIITSAYGLDNPASHYALYHNMAQKAIDIEMKERPDILTACAICYNHDSKYSKRGKFLSRVALAVIDQRREPYKNVHHFHGSSKALRNYGYAPDFVRGFRRHILEGGVQFYFGDTAISCKDEVELARDQLKAKFRYHFANDNTDELYARRTTSYAKSTKCGYQIVEEMVAAWTTEHPTIVL